MSGPYRKCSADTPGAEWDEGVGWHVFDGQASEAFRRQQRGRIIACWQQQEREALAKLNEARSVLSRLAKEPTDG